MWRHYAPSQRLKITALFLDIEVLQLGVDEHRGMPKPHLYILLLSKILIVLCVFQLHFASVLHQDA